MSKKLLNGNTIPDFGFGTFPQKEELIESLHSAIKNNPEGIIIDTSDDYYNHNYVSRVINNKTSNNIVLCTKFSFPHMLCDFDKAFEITRKELNIQNKPVDIYLLHWPYPYIFLDAWKEMEKLYKQGKVKAIGVCNCETHHLKYLLKHCEIPPMVNELEVHPLFQQKETCDFCGENGIVVFSYSPFARNDENVVKNDLLLALASRYNKSVRQIILRWNFQKGYIALPSSKNKNHVVSNYDILNFNISEKDMDSIAALDCNYRVRFNPNTYFSTRDKLGHIKKHLKYTLKTEFKRGT